MKVNIGPYPDKDNVKRIVEIQIDKYDTWNLDNTLAMIILPCLKQLRDTTHGYPASLANYKEDEYEIIDDSGANIWKEILNKMINSFERIADISDYEYDDEVQEGLNLFAKYYCNLWD